MPELGKSGSVGAVGEQSPAATRLHIVLFAFVITVCKHLFQRDFLKKCQAQNL